MKLSKEALLEIVAILQDGLIGAKDISQALRELDLVDERQLDEHVELVLSQEYIASHPRAPAWDQDGG